MSLSKSWFRRSFLPAMLISACALSGCRQSSWSLWNAYSARFVDAQGRVHSPGGDHPSTSDAQAYALFFALAADDRPHFDLILSWTQTNLAQGDLETHLPACRWGEDQHGSLKSDPNSSSNADVWIAYSLIEAGQLWKDPQYSRTGQRMLGLIAVHEVANLPGFGAMLLPGSTGYARGNHWELNPGDLPEFVFERFDVVDPAGPWREIAANTPRLLEESARHGYAMDWVEYFPGDGFYPASSELPETKSGSDSIEPGGGEDAIRVYLWAGMENEREQTRARLVNAVSAMSGYLASHDAPPERVSDEGVPTPQDGPVGFSAAVLPYLRAFPHRSPVSAQQMIRMSLMKDASTGLYGKDLDAYDQELALFATGYVDGRFRFGPDGNLIVNWSRQ